MQTQCYWKKKRLWKRFLEGAGPSLSMVLFPWFAGDEPSLCALFFHQYSPWVVYFPTQWEHLYWQSRTSRGIPRLLLDCHTFHLWELLSPLLPPSAAWEQECLKDSSSWALWRQLLPLGGWEGSLAEMCQVCPVPGHSLACWLVSARGSSPNTAISSDWRRRARAALSPPDCFRQPWLDLVMLTRGFPCSWTGWVCRTLGSHLTPCPLDEGWVTITPGFTDLQQLLKLLGNGSGVQQNQPWQGWTQAARDRNKHLVSMSLSETKSTLTVKRSLLLRRAFDRQMTKLYSACRGVLGSMLAPASQQWSVCCSCKIPAPASRLRQQENPLPRHSAVKTSSLCGETPPGCFLCFLLVLSLFSWNVLYF